jgi:primosomal protein N' (replication factor Y)
VDRETTRTRAAQAALDTRLPEHGPALLVGTQMLAKGHDLPRLTLVAVTSVDEGLYSVDFRAPERLAQLIVQVAGRAGRGGAPGRVLLQTRHPDHPLLLQLLSGGYQALAASLLEERRAARLPPFAYHALLRAEATHEAALFAFLDAARAALAMDAGIEIVGPMPAPLPLRGPRWCGQLLLAGAQRGALHRALRPWALVLETLPHARALRWSLDVDPLEMG